MTPVKNSCNRGASEPWRWVGGETLTCPWWIQQPSTCNQEPRRSLRSLPPFTPSVPPTPLLFPTPWFSCCSSPLTSGPHANLIWHSSHELVLWPPACCRTACLIMSDYCLILLSVSICLSLSLCLTLPFTLCRGRRLVKTGVSPFWRVEMMAIIAAGGQL